jgi:hypothetical protein
MKQASLIISTSVLVMGLFTLLLVGACSKPDLQYNGTIIEACKNVVCYNGGNCLDGRCNCPVGFAGTNCNTAWNSLFTGEYQAVDQCDLSNNYNVQITPQVNKADGLSLSNIGTSCPGAVLKATINPDKSTIDIPTQNFCNDIYITGTGTQTEDGKYINIWLSGRDSLAKITTSCSIVLRKL